MACCRNIAERNRLPTVYPLPNGRGLGEFKKNEKMMMSLMTMKGLQPRFCAVGLSLEFWLLCMQVPGRRAVMQAYFTTPGQHTRLLIIISKIVVEVLLVIQ